MRGQDLCEPWLKVLVAMSDGVDALSGKRMVQVAGLGPYRLPLRLEVITRNDLQQLPCWQIAFANERKDHRYYELIEDTLHPEFDYRYFVIKDATGEARAVQPCFLLDQDLLVGMIPLFGRLIAGIRRFWPRFMRLRTLMLGCVAAEGHLDGGEACHPDIAQLLSSSLADHARTLGARLVVLKEFPARYRSTLECFLRAGFTRIPSLPMTRLLIDYANFNDYMKEALNSATRRKLRKKFEAADRPPTIKLSVINDVTPVIDQVYSLYLKVYRRSKLHFEKLTKDVSL